MKLLVRIFLFLVFFLLGGYSYIYTNSFQGNASFVSGKAIQQSGDIWTGIVSTEPSHTFRNILLPAKKKIFCIYEEESENKNVKLDYSRNKSAISNYFNKFYNQLSEWFCSSAVRPLRFREHFFLLSSHRQILLQVIRI